MAQQKAARGETESAGPNTAQTRIGATVPAESTAGSAREILDRCVGHHGESLRDAGGKIVEVNPDPMSVFDAEVFVELPDDTRVISSKGLGALGIDTLEFFGNEPRDDGAMLTTFAAEYEGTHLALTIIRGAGETQETRSADNE